MEWPLDNIALALMSVYHSCLLPLWQLSRLVTKFLN